MLRLINGLCTAVSVAISLLTVKNHLKNYRKPLDQRLIVRILLFVPLFSISAFASLYCPWKLVASVLTIIREVYEAFVIYTFYSLLTNLLGGEREIIYAKTGDVPVKFMGCKVDISDPHTFWVVKWLIMQYVCVRPIIVLLNLFVSSSWASWTLVVLYNISITLALNSLMAFWVCLKQNLEPYQVVLKFLSVKMIVFFSYWQVLVLKIVSAMGYISHSRLPVYENTLLCVECVVFAIVHSYAFPASDYEATFLFGFSRLKLQYACRDFIGIKDLVHDFKSTFLSPRYGVRDFDSVEAILDHPESGTRQRRIAAGLRYQNGGKSKYWLPSLSLNLKRHNCYGATEVTQPLLSDNFPAVSETVRVNEPELVFDDQYTQLEDDLYDIAKKSYGDYNYPVVVVRESEEYVSFEDRLRRQRVMSL